MLAVCEVRVFQWGIFGLGASMWAAVWINESGSRLVVVSMGRSARRVTEKVMRK